MPNSREIDLPVAPASIEISYLGTACTRTPTWFRLPPTSRVQPILDPLQSRTRTKQRTKLLPSLLLSDQTSPTTSHLDISATMGRSKGARKKTGIKPWHSVYVHLNLPGLVDGVIPKRIRAIEGAKARLKTARSVRAARVEWRHIDTNLWAIECAYSKIRRALRDGYAWSSRYLPFLVLPYVQAFPQLIPRICSCPNFFLDVPPSTLLSPKPVKSHLQIVLRMLIWLS